MSTSYSSVSAVAEESGWIENELPLKGGQEKEVENPDGLMHAIKIPGAYGNRVFGGCFYGRTIRSVVFAEATRNEGYE